MSKKRVPARGKAPSTTTYDKAHRVLIDSESYDPSYLHGVMEEWCDRGVIA